MSELPVLELSGSHRDRGLAHGEHFRENVKDTINVYRRRFRSHDLNDTTIDNHAGQWSNFIKKVSPDFYVEMAAVAEGAGVTVEDIALINARYEMTWGLSGKDIDTFDQHGELLNNGCTTFAVDGTLSEDGNLYLGQTYDWMSAIYPNCVVLRVKPDGKPSYICHTEAGVIGGKIAVNEFGIGFVINGLVSKYDGVNPTMEIPWHVRARGIIEATTFDYALLPVVKTRRMGSSNFVIGQHYDSIGGNVVNLECTPDYVNYLYPVNGIVTHSNHFSADHSVSRFEKLSPSTLYRNVRMEQLLKHNPKTLEGYKNSLKDHFGFPNSICRHNDDRMPEEKRVMTICAAVVDLANRSLWLSNGEPCVNEFIEYKL
jgi:isopenicillin-N N-acyltransferase like protein